MATVTEANSSFGADDATVTIKRDSVTNAISSITWTRKSGVLVIDVTTAGQSPLHNMLDVGASGTILFPNTNYLKGTARVESSWGP